MMDEFYKGAELGLRVSNQRQQQQQFKTNLAERSRQFDLNHKLAQDNYSLSQKEFTHRQEQAVIENQYRIAATKRVQHLNQEEKRLAQEEEDFGDVVTGYEVTLSRWKGNGNVPPIPPGLPKTQHERALGFQKNAAGMQATGRLAREQTAHDEAMQKEYIEGFKWARENAWQILNRDENGTWGYRYEDLLKAKQSVANLNQQYGFRGIGLQPTSAQSVDPLTKGQVQWGVPPRKLTPQQRKTEWFEKNISKFIDQDNGFNQEAAEAAWQAIEGIRNVNGVPIDPNDI